MEGLPCGIKLLHALSFHLLVVLRVIGKGKRGNHDFPFPKYKHVFYIAHQSFTLVDFARLTASQLTLPRFRLYRLAERATDPSWVGSLRIASYKVLIEIVMALGEGLVICV